MERKRGVKRRMVMVVPEKSHVEALKRTFELVGPLYPVLVEEDGKVLQGSNRLTTGKDWPKQVKKIRSNRERLLIRLLGNVQRQPKEEEVKYLLNKIAEDFVASEEVPEVEASEAICKMLSPQIYTEHHIRRLLDPKYKVKYRSEAGAKGGHQKAENQRFANMKLAKGESGDGVSEDAEEHEEDVEKVVEEAEQEAEEEKTACDDLSKTADGSPAYPYPECRCSACTHKEDCY